MPIKPYVSVDDATMILGTVFAQAIKKWKTFSKDYDKKHGTNIYNRTILQENIFRWKKIGFRCAGRACRQGTGVNANLYIEMNTNYLYSKDANDFIQSTPLHELAHVIAYLIDGSWGHDKTWKAVARVLGDDGSRCHNYAAPENKPKKNDPVFRKFQCPNCGNTVILTEKQVARYSKPGYACKCGCKTTKFIKKIDKM